MKKSKILVTGAAGFIGFYLAKRLIDSGYSVIGLDNINDYYSVDLKKDRLAQLEGFSNFSFIKMDLADRKAMEELFSSEQFDMVVHLAAQAGVRYSLENPNAYIDSNLVGFANILEGCRHNPVKHLVFASSSSVYGANKKMPFSVEDFVDNPVSLYAATKKSNELMAHAYSHLYKIPSTGLRFFTVYGPWGRPDMAYFKFTKAILAGEQIDVYNHGNMKRDFTYIDDIIEGVARVMDKSAKPKVKDKDATLELYKSSAPFAVYNIGNNKPVELGYFIQALEEAIGRKAKKNMLPMQPGDVPATYADIDSLTRDVGFKPDTPIEKGLQKFVDWYKEYY
jgi:UDP-glucuronate 4-epimerase